jgi:16S rRNA (cytosine1402-N4)-methyltransferase
LQDIPHIPVLYREVEATFSDIPEGIVIDCTMGYAGHSSLILQTNPNIRLIGIDQDQTAIDFSSKRLEPFKDRVQIKKGRFSEMAKEIFDANGKEEIRGLLADIGVSSLQLDEKGRGFGFESENLDMRMDPSRPFSAADVVNSYGQNELERIFFDYGEIRNAKNVSPQRSSRPGRCIRPKSSRNWSVLLRLEARRYIQLRLSFRRSVSRSTMNWVNWKLCWML